jgi:hypothetical protein
LHSFQHLHLVLLALVVLEEIQMVLEVLAEQVLLVLC